MSKSHDKPWKVKERVVAAFHGLTRNPLSGMNSGRVGDAYDPVCGAPWAYIEVKMRKAHSILAYLREHTTQVKKVTGDGNPLCVLALAENKKPGFWMVVHSTQIVRYSILLLEKRGYRVIWCGSPVDPVEEIEDASLD